ncbi:hypothetical protein Plav_0206 [Parvibaculum lavamentivorans DS-1]|uniref:Uncharacterized protein n=1 Tax=Parvibaculum lavamentivorans (strain DS-1 / DSM 13023 / NCIMB 13966) TaxID=402881 RepID=A7HPJ6_PARL1|nr:hypothetical protein [Parvibaculum lavamentivorans]ABS61829.1 hypothetical protein Plav_0206 [Parvibaculum lavamentivorans DS-1]
MSKPVIALWFGAGGEAHAEAGLKAIRESHPGVRLLLLTRREAAGAHHALADEIWDDGAVRGASAFLARARRLSWASPGHIYDLEGSRMTVFLRLCVWPRPQWHHMTPNPRLAAETGLLS